MNIFIVIVSIVIILLVVMLVKWADSPWVKAKGGRYRMYQVHGMFRTWEYRLQKRNWLGCWSTVYDEYDHSEDSDQYKALIKKYKMKIRHR